MADKITLLIESMMPDLLFLIKRQIFSKEEIKSIIKTRENLEYGITKKSAKITNFLKAIQFEYDLEKIRRQKFNLNENKKTNPRDFSIIKRIIQLFDRSTYKYKYNISLWNQYLVFCYKIKAKKIFFKAISNALKVLPSHLNFWLLGAYYEMEIEGNPFKGRKILLKGAKILGKNEDFWLEYIRYEISFLKIIVKRREILIGSSKIIEENDGFLAFDKKKEVSKDLINENEEKNLEYIKTIYDTAKKQLKENYSFCFKIKKIIEEFSEIKENLINFENIIKEEIISQSKFIIIDSIKTEIENPIFIEMNLISNEKSIIMHNFEINLKDVSKILFNEKKFKFQYLIIFINYFIAAKDNLNENLKDNISILIIKNVLNLSINELLTILPRLIPLKNELKLVFSTEIIEFIKKNNNDILILTKLIDLFINDQNILDFICENSKNIIKQLRNLNKENRDEFLLKLILLIEKEKNGKSIEKIFAIFFEILGLKSNEEEINYFTKLIKICKSLNNEKIELCFKIIEKNQFNWTADLHIEYINWLIQKNEKYEIIHSYFKKISNFLKNSDKVWVKWLDFESKNRKMNEVQKILEKAKINGLYEKKEFLLEYNKIINS